MGENNTETEAVETSKGYSALEYRNLSFWLFWAGIVFVYIILRINMVNIPLERDEGMFGYMGQLILDGGLPYRDAFDHKPPIVFYLNALALILVPPTPFGIHLFLHTYNFITLIALYILARTYLESPTAGLWVALAFAVFSSSPGIEGYAATTEMFLLLPLTLSFLFAVLAVRKSNSYCSVLSGLFGALTFWTKQTAALIILFFVLYLIVAQLHSNGSKGFDFVRPLKSLLLWCCGFLTISLMIAGYFYYGGGLDEFIYANFTYNFTYSKGLKFTTILPALWRVIRKIVTGNFFIICVGLVVSIVSMFRRKKSGYFVSAFFLFSFLSTLPGHAYWHYFAQLAPSIAIAGGFGVFFIIERIRNRKLKVLCSSLCILGTVAIPVIVHHGYYFTRSPEEISRYYFGSNPFPESIELAKYLANRTWPDDTVFVLGSEPQLFLYSQRKSATSFPYVYPLMSVYPRYMEFQRKVWEEINRSEPKYIISVELPTSLMWDGKADLWLITKMRRLISLNYYLEAVMTIERPKGRLFVLSELDNPENVLKDRPVLIYIFRSKSS